MLHRVESFIMTTDVGASDNADHLLEQVQSYIQQVKNFVDLGKEGKKRKQDQGDAGAPAVKAQKAGNDDEAPEKREVDNVQQEDQMSKMENRLQLRSKKKVVRNLMMVRMRSATLVRAWQQHSWHPCLKGKRRHPPKRGDHLLQ
eukprot:2171111-Amphidinium_carterae.1